jgi:hypothetical protein
MQEEGTATKRLYFLPNILPWVNTQVSQDIQAVQNTQSINTFHFMYVILYHSRYVLN